MWAIYFIKLNYHYNSNSYTFVGIWRLMKRKTLISIFTRFFRISTKRFALYIIWRELFFDLTQLFAPGQPRKHFPGPEPDLSTIPEVLFGLIIFTLDRT